MTVHEVGALPIKHGSYIRVCNLFHYTATPWTEWFLNFNFFPYWRRVNRVFGFRRKTFALDTTNAFPIRTFKEGGPAAFTFEWFGLDRTSIMPSSLPFRRTRSFRFRASIYTTLYYLSFFHLVPLLFYFIPTVKVSPYLSFWFFIILTTMSCSISHF